MDRTANRRVGAAATVAFAALLLIGASHGPAQASPAAPAATPDSAPGFRHDHEPRRDGFDGPGAPPISPAPDSGTNMS